MRNWVSSVVVGILLLQAIALPAKGSELPFFIKMKGTKVVSVSAKKLEVFSTAVFFNTYNNKAKITEVDIDLFLDDRYIGKVTNHVDVIVHKRSTFDVPLIYSKDSPITDVGSLLWRGGKLIAGKNVRIKYIGYIKMKVIGFIPIKIKFEDEILYSLY